MLGSRSPSSQGSVTLPSDIPALPQCLPVDPITLGNQKNPRSGELRRVLGVPYGSMTEDHSFGVSQLKPPPPVATEELKHFKESVHDSTRKARDQIKYFHEKIFKFDKYRESLNSKKRQHIDVSPIDQSSTANLVKMGSQIQRNSHDLMTQRLEGRTKSVGVNKLMLELLPLQGSKWLQEKMEICDLPLVGPPLRLKKRSTGCQLEVKDGTGR